MWGGTCRAPARRVSHTEPHGLCTHTLMIRRRQPPRAEPPSQTQRPADTGPAHALEWESTHPTPEHNKTHTHPHPHINAPPTFHAKCIALPHLSKPRFPRQHAQRVRKPINAVHTPWRLGAHARARRLIHGPFQKWVPVLCPRVTVTYHKGARHPPEFLYSDSGEVHHPPPLPSE
jgi:hypothetical protein